VYTAPSHIGRGGWTWYTGSAAWLYRAALETLLGFTKRGDQLSFTPCVPATWSGFEVDYRHGSSFYRCRIETIRAEDERSAGVWLDGERLPDEIIPLRDDGRDHAVTIVFSSTKC
jgi:cellobiose phosphorylase